MAGQIKRGAKSRLEIIERIREEQLTRFVKDEETSCWMWYGGKCKDGYGKLKRYGKTVRAHRVFYEINKGPIPEGMVIMHTCDTPACVNPEHLIAGTHLENELDKDKKGRRSPSPSISHPESLPRGPNHPNFGKPMKPHVKEALRIANLNKILTIEEKEKRSPLVREQAQAILDDARPAVQVSKDYNVSASTVVRIRAGKRWKHLTKTS